jgi:hypothetical protein
MYLLRNVAQLYHIQVYDPAAYRHVGRHREGQGLGHVRVRLEHFELADDDPVLEASRRASGAWQRARPQHDRGIAR